MKVPPGVTFNVRESKGEGGAVWFWTLRKWGQDVAHGHASTEAKAKKVLADEIMKLTEKGQSASYARMKAKQHLKRMLENRTHAMQAALELLLLGADEDQLKREIEATEEAWRQKTPKEFRQAVPTHHRALTAQQVAERAVESFLTLGYLVKNDGVIQLNGGRLQKWAHDMFGEDFNAA